MPVACIPDIPCEFPNVVRIFCKLLFKETVSAVRPQTAGGLTTYHIKKVLVVTRHFAIAGGGDAMANDDTSLFLETFVEDARRSDLGISVILAAKCLATVDLRWLHVTSLYRPQNAGNPLMHTQRSRLTASRAPHLRFFRQKTPW